MQNLTSKDEIQTYLESECIIQQETRRLMNIKLTNFESCNILSIKSIKFKMQQERNYTQKDIKTIK